MSYCDHLPRSIKALDMDIGKLDDSYNKLTEVMAEERGMTTLVGVWVANRITKVFYSGQQMYIAFTDGKLCLKIYMIYFGFDLELRWKAKSEKAMKESTFLCRPQKILLQQVDLPQKITQTFHNHYIYAE